MIGTRSTVGERVVRGFRIVAEGPFGVVTVTVAVTVAVTVGGREGCLRSAERLVKEKVDASECRIEALLLLLRDPVVVVVAFSMAMAMGGVQTG